MIQIKGALDSLKFKSRKFLRNAQYFHIVLAVCMLGTGIAAVVLSEGSDGTAKVPYFFNAFIAGVWHIVFVMICQLGMHYLTGDGSQSSKACALVRAYSIVSSVFVLFNVMGVVFTVVNGICIESMMCYYDRNHASNRSMAILLILEHCLSILASVVLAKQSHVIDSELSTDVSIKLNLHFDFLRIRTRKFSSGSVHPLETPRSQQTTPSRDGNQDQSALTEIHSKGGHVLTTIEISAMTHKKTHRRSKSQPIMFKQLDLKPPDIEGHVFSIYSDSEMKTDEKERKKKRRFIPHRKGKSSRATTIEIKTNAKIQSRSERTDTDSNFSGSDSLSSYGTPRMSVEAQRQKLNEVELARKTTSLLSAADSADDIMHVKPAQGSEAEQLHMQQELLERQAKLQREQEKLFEEQRKLFQVQQQKVETKLEQPVPPPYASWENLKQIETEGSRITLHEHHDAPPTYHSFEAGSHYSGTTFQAENSHPDSESYESAEGAPEYNGTTFQEGYSAPRDSEC